MSSIIDSVYKANEGFQINLNGKNEFTKVLTTHDIDDTVKLYKHIYSELLKTKNEKFLHEMKHDDLYEIMSTDSQAIIGYYKEKQLVGALYTKPFEENSPYFSTPKFDEGKITYALGGLAVNPNFRGNGVINKLARIFYKGVKDFATENPESNIAGVGAEISCENFSSLSSAGYLRTDDGTHMFNLAGYHFVANNSSDNDLTILGYNSFENTPEKIDEIEKIQLNGNQSDSFGNISATITKMAEKSAGLNITTIDEHNIITLNSYIDAPYKEVLILGGDEQ